MFIKRVALSKLSLEKRQAQSAARRFGWTSMPESLSLTQIWMRPSRPSKPSGLRQVCRLELSSRRDGGFMSIGSAKSLGLPKNGRLAQGVLKAYAAGLASMLTQQERLTPLRSCVFRARTTAKANWRNARFDFYTLEGSILVHCLRRSSMLRLSRNRPLKPKS